MATAWRPNPCADRTAARGPRLRCFFKALTYRCDKAVNLRFMVPAGLTRLQAASPRSSCLLFWLFDPSPVSQPTHISIRRRNPVVYRGSPRLSFSLSLRAHFSPVRFEGVRARISLDQSGVCGGNPPLVG